MVAAVLLLGGSSSFAGPLARLVRPKPTERDVQLAVYARQALMDDEMLAPLNVGVSVRQSVATLWGPVPSPAHVQRARERVQRVRGVIEVRSELHVAPSDVPLADVVPPEEKLPPLPGPRTVGALTGRQEAPKPPVLVESVSLLPPVAHLVTPVIPVPPDAVLGLPLAVEQVRQSDPRFRLLKLQIQGGAIHLFGLATRWEDVAELSRRLSLLAGVERVVPQGVQIDPRLSLGR
jgi:hypothetical protein